MDEMEEWYFEIDLKGNFTFFNDILADALGLSRDDLIGKNYREFIKKEDSASISRLFYQIFKTGRSTREFLLRIHPQERVSRLYRVFLFPQKKQGGKDCRIPGGWTRHYRTQARRRPGSVLRYARWPYGTAQPRTVQPTAQPRDRVRKAP